MPNRRSERRCKPAEYPRYGDSSIGSRTLIASPSPVLITFLHNHHPTGESLPGELYLFPDPGVAYNIYPDVNSLVKVFPVLSVVAWQYDCGSSNVAEASIVISVGHVDLSTAGGEAIQYSCLTS